MITVLTYKDNYDNDRLINFTKITTQEDINNFVKLQEQEIEFDKYEITNHWKPSHYPSSTPAGQLIKTTYFLEFGKDIDTIRQNHFDFHKMIRLIQV